MVKSLHLRKRLHGHGPLHLPWIENVFRDLVLGAEASEETEALEEGILTT